MPVKPIKRSEEERRRIAELNRERTERNRQALFDKLGAVCVGCGYNENPAFLNFDHVHGGGNKTRGTGTKKTTASNVYSRYMKKLKSEPGSIQVLCMGCHGFKQMGVRIGNMKL